MLGWECPRCRTIHGPFVQSCDCPPPYSITTSDSTWPTITQEDIEAERARMEKEGTLRHIDTPSGLSTDPRPPRCTTRIANP